MLTTTRPIIEIATASSGGESSSGVRVKLREYDEKLVEYFIKNSGTFRELYHYRELGWSCSEGDKWFAKQRKDADESDEVRQKHFYEMMKRIGAELQTVENAFSIPRNEEDPSFRPRILDFCTAPGGFLWQALKTNPSAQATGFTLPEIDGGHKVRLPLTDHPDSKILSVDITLLAADMGVTSIPDHHPDAQQFLSHRFFPSSSPSPSPSSSNLDSQPFDLAICDGQVLRTHDRAPYRDQRERYRLLFTQLALALQHLRPGGKMVVLLRNIDDHDTATLLYRFHQFSKIRLRKPRVAHVTRGSFYMVAEDVQPQHPDAKLAVRAWGEVWRAATFGDEGEYAAVSAYYEVPVGEMLELFGRKLVEIGEPVWRVQKEALRGASWMRRD